MGGCYMTMTITNYPAPNYSLWKNLTSTLAVPGTTKRVSKPASLHKLTMQLLWSAMICYGLLNVILQHPGSLAFSTECRCYVATKHFSMHGRWHMVTCINDFDILLIRMIRTCTQWSGELLVAAPRWWRRDRCLQGVYKAHDAGLFRSCCDVGPDHKKYSQGQWRRTIC